MGMREEKVCVDSQQPAREEPCALHHIAHGGAASFVPDSGSEHQGSGSSVIFGRPHRAARRTHEDKHRELDALELKIPYSMAVVPDCTITGTGIHVSCSCARVRECPALSSCGFASGLRQLYGPVIVSAPTLCSMLLFVLCPGKHLVPGFQARNLGGLHRGAFAPMPRGGGKAQRKDWYMPCVGCVFFSTALRCEL